MPFEEDLSVFLYGSRRVLLIGMGNTVRKDDAAGIRVITRGRGRVPPGAILLNVGTTPENYSSKIKQLKPTHVIFFDAVEMKKNPGEYCFINEETLVSQSMSTHKQPLSMLMAVLKEGIPDVSIKLVGIQPKTVEFGYGMSTAVDRGVDSLVGVLFCALGRALR